MQGTAVGRNLAPRYYCATRRANHSCDQPLVHADLVENQLVDFVADFKPGADARDEILRRLAKTAGPETAEAAKHRGTLEQRLRRVRDLYELGDLSRPEYLARRDAINAELDAHAPDPLPNLAQARLVLDDFAIFWRAETDREAKRQLLQLVFERVWLDARGIVAVQPKPSFVAFFQDRVQKSPAQTMCKERERRDSNPRPPA